MNKSEILSELESLLDYLNDAGKGKVQRIKAAVHELEEKVLPSAEPQPEAVERRSEERDPGESEQRQADALGLLKPKKGAKK